MHVLYVHCITSICWFFRSISLIPFHMILSFHFEQNVERDQHNEKNNEMSKRV